MAKKGRPPKPTALKKLHGNPGKRPLNKAEPQPHIGTRTPNAPDWLNDAAKEQWKRYARTMWELGLLTEIDVVAFGAWCTWLALFIEAKDVVENGGMTQTADSGWSGQTPEVNIMGQAWAKVEKLGGLFGMTPSDRSKLRIEEVEKELDLAEQLFALTQGK